MIRHEEGIAERADDLDRIAFSQVAQIVGTDTSNRLACVVHRHAFHGDRQIVIPRSLAIARAGNRILAHVMCAAAGIDARREDSDRLALEDGKRRAAKIQNDVVGVAVGSNIGHSEIADDRRQNRALVRKQVDMWACRRCGWPGGTENRVAGCDDR